MPAGTGVSGRESDGDGRFFCGGGDSPRLHQLLARAERHGARLLVGRFRLHETHGRTLGRLNDRLGVGGVVLLPLQERLDVMRRDQPVLVTAAGYFSCPVVRAGASLHSHEAAAAPP